MYLSEIEYDARMQKIRMQNESKIRKNNLKKEKQKYKTKLKIKIPSTSKLVLLGVFFMCFEIIVFCQYAIIVLGDTSAMYALIGVPATLIPTIISYYNKSKAENTGANGEGIVYQSMMNEFMKNNHMPENKQDNKQDIGGLDPDECGQG